MICQQTGIFGSSEINQLNRQLVKGYTMGWMDDVYMKRLCSCCYRIVYSILNLILNWMTVSRWWQMIVGATICRKKINHNVRWTGFSRHESNLRILGSPLITYDIFILGSNSCRISPCCITHSSSAMYYVTDARTEQKIYNSKFTIVEV